MESLINNKFVQLAVVVVVCYFLFKMVSKNNVTENLDDVLSSSTTTTSSVPVTTPTAPTLTITPSQQLLVQSPLSTSSTSVSGLGTSSATDDTTTTTSNVTSTADLQYTALTDDDMKTVLGVNTEQMLQRPEDEKLIMKDLIPTLDKDTDLFSQFKPDPKYDQYFLQNRFSPGIDASTTSRHYVNDMRGGLPVPFASAEAFNNPTQFPDIYRKSLCEVI